MKRTVKFLTVAVALAALLPASGTLLAQGMGGSGEGHGGQGMSRMHAFSPHHLLMHGDALALTSDQRTSLIRIQQDAAAAQEVSQASHDEKQAQLMALFSGGVTVSDARSLFGAAHAAGGEAHWAMINAAIESMALLDEMQLARAHGWADMMEMMGMMGKMGEEDEGGHMGAGHMGGGDDDGEDEDEHEEGGMRH